MTDVELLCEALQVASLEELNKELYEAKDDTKKGREILLKQV